MKKLWKVLFALSLATSLGACQKKETVEIEATPTMDTEPTPTVETENETVDEETNGYAAYPNETEFVEIRLGYDSEVVTMKVPTDYFFTGAVERSNDESVSVTPALNITTIADALEDGTLNLDKVYEQMSFNSNGGEVIVNVQAFPFDSGLGFESFDSIKEMGGDDVIINDGTAMRSCVQTGLDNCDLILYVEALNDTCISISYAGHNSIEALEMGQNVYELLTAE